MQAKLVGALKYCSLEINVRKCLKVFLLGERENYDWKEENNTLVQKTIFIFSAEGKPPEFLWLNLVNMLYV